MRPLLSLAFILALLAAPLSAAAQRILPTDIRVGLLEEVRYPNILISNRWHRLAPGSTIHTRDNRILTPNGVRGRGWVAYNFDHFKQVRGVWMLTEPEIATLESRGYEFRDD
jgi:hypothetical protein